MPNYNHGRYIERALRAILTQAEPPLEIIVVDDTSTDDSCAVIERLMAAHPIIRLMRNEQRTGVDATINRGLREARGDYIALLAADDEIGPNLFSHSLTILAEYPSAGFCFSDPADVARETGEVSTIPLCLSERPCRIAVADFVHILRRNFFNISSNTVIYRRDALMAAGGLPEDLGSMADWFINYVIAFRYGVCYVPEVLGLFYKSRRSYSSQMLRDRMAERAILSRMLELLREPIYQDVMPAFRSAAILPDFRPWVLGWMLTSSDGRAYLTPRLFARLVFRGLWTMLLPYCPVRLRRLARWFVGRHGRRRTAQRGTG